MNDIGALLRQNSYPGRGIVLGMSEDGACGAAAYFIMGRSENSRNRIFAAEKDGIRTEAFDESKMVDPSLIIYRPVRVFEDTLIVTNGDQTDTIYDFMAVGSGIYPALRSREFEPDAPNYTPRISGTLNMNTGRYLLAILKAGGGRPPECLRFFYEYRRPRAGTGHFIHTYGGDGDPLPSFSGEPGAVAVPADIDEFADAIWNGLNAENKVSLFVRYVNLSTKQSETRMINKNV